MRRFRRISSSSINEEVGKPPSDILRLAKFGGADPGLDSIRCEASGRFMLPANAPIPLASPSPWKPGIPPNASPNPGGVCFSSVVDILSVCSFIYMLVIYNDCLCMYMQGVICTALYSVVCSRFSKYNPLCAWCKKLPTFTRRVQYICTKDSRTLERLGYFRLLSFVCRFFSYGHVSK